MKINFAKYVFATVNFHVVQSSLQYYACSTGNYTVVGLKDNRTECGKRNEWSPIFSLIIRVINKARGDILIKVTEAHNLLPYLFD